MMCGSANEESVLTTLSSMNFIKGVFEMGMVALQDYHYLACSPDGVPVLDGTF